MSTQPTQQDLDDLQQALTQQILKYLIVRILLMDEHLKPANASNSIAHRRSRQLTY